MDIFPPFSKHISPFGVWFFEADVSKTSLLLLDFPTEPCSVSGLINYVILFS
jgi:hypothetical protein